MGCRSSKSIAASHLQPVQRSATVKDREAFNVKDESVPGAKSPSDLRTLPAPPAVGSISHYAHDAQREATADNTSESDSADDDKAIQKIRAYLVRASVSDGFGFGIGLTTGNEVFITDLLDSSVAAKSLNIADRIDRINGTAVSSMAFPNILSQISGSLVGTRCHARCICYLFNFSVTYWYFPVSMVIFARRTFVRVHACEHTNTRIIQRTSTHTVHTFTCEQPPARHTHTQTQTGTRKHSRVRT